MRINLRAEDREHLAFIKEADMATLINGRDAQNAPYLDWVFSLHKLLFGQACGGCPGKIPGYINRIKNFELRPYVMTKETRQFEFEQGVVVPVFGTSRVYSNHNLTDEIAIELLRDNINRKALFKKLPRNLNALLAQDQQADLKSKKARPALQPKEKVRPAKPDAKKV